jgi:molecular chaperone HscB
MSDAFELLGISRAFAQDIAAVEKRFRELSKAFHPDRQVDATPGDRRASAEHTVSLNEALRAIKDPMSRAQLLLALSGRPIEETARAAPELLMQIMELREQAEEGRRDRSQIEGILQKIHTLIEAQEQTLQRCFDGQRWPAPAELLSSAYDAGVRLKYLYRLRDELSDLE